MTRQLPEWQRIALADPNLPEKHWQLLKLGPSSLGEAFILQAIKWKYQIRGTNKYE